MENSTICEQCGAPLPDAQPDGQCPACLLKRGLGELESVGSPPAELAETFVPKEPAPVGTTNGVLLPGTQFGDYEIVRRLGSGGMGTVYEANQLTTGRRVALKVLSHSLDSKEARSRFLREGRLAASINHPNSVYVFGTEEIDGVPTISMELIAGGTLASEVQKFGAMSVPNAVDAVLQVLDGLEAAERKGVLHRDIKPSNCFVDANGNVKVGDYGLSISTMPTNIDPATMTQEGTFLGTPAFASPEQLRGEQLDQRSDIYSVGVTLYYLLTGRPPFEGKNLVQLLATVLDKDPIAVSDDRADVPQALSDIVKSCLSKSSGSRPASYAELRELLRPFSSETSKPATIGQRCLAGFLDYLVVTVLISLVSVVGVACGVMDWWTESWWPFGLKLAVVTLAYFCTCEAKWGQTIGKRLVGIRVTANGDLLSITAAYRRAMWYVAVAMLGIGIEHGFSLLASTLLTQSEAGPWLHVISYARFIGYCGLLWLFWPTSRRQEPARHDRFTGTTVVQTPDAALATVPDTKPDTFDPTDVTETIGPYHILETLAVEDATKLHLAFDTKLLRRVWLRTHPNGADELPATERNLARVTRLRWLGGHRARGENWDCYEAPPGVALADHDRTWQSDRHAIASLADELRAAVEDGTLPNELCLSNLWIGQSRIKLLPFAAPAQTRDEHCVPTGSSREDQIAACIRFVALVAERLAAHSEHEAIPIRARAALSELSTVKSLERTQELAGRLTTGLAGVSRGRRLLFLLATFALPLVMTLTSMFSQVMTLATGNPQLGQMAGALSQAQRYASTPDRNDDLHNAWKVYLAGTYRDTFQDASVWNTIGSRFQIPRATRRGIEQVMASHEPTEIELATARATLQKFIDDSDTVRAGLTIDEFMIKYYGQPHGLHFGYLIIGCFNWLLTIWLPGLVTALFGGGLFQRALGVAFADRSGRQLSGLRALWRAFLPGVPFLIAVPIMLMRPQSLASTFAFGLAGLLLLSVTAWRKRFISDVLAGSQIVAR